MKEIKKICYVPWIGTPKKNEVFYINSNSWEYFLNRNLQKKGIKILTDDKLEIKKADACLFFDNVFYKNLDRIWELYDNRLLENSVYIDYEPPTGHCKNHTKKGLKRLSKIFKYVITYDDDLVDNKKIIKGNIANFYSKEIKYKGDFNTRKLLVMITNNTTNNAIIDILNHYNSSIYYNRFNTRMHQKELYYKRKEAAYYFTKKIPNDFDLYGILWPDKFNKVSKGLINKKDKIRVMSGYNFIISFDSYFDQNGYISEKIFDAFNAKVVPIYLGASNVEKYIPKECFIDMRNYTSYKDLLFYLKNMTKEEYEKYINAIELYLKSDNYKKYFSSMASAKIIEKALLAPQKDFSYEKALQEINYFQKKKDKVVEKSKINYYISKYDNRGRDIIISFELDYWGKDKDNFFEVYVNGIKQKLDHYQKIISKEELLIKYKFECAISNIKNIKKIVVLNVTKNQVKRMKLNPYMIDLCLLRGLYTSFSRQTIIYNRLIGRSKIGHFLLILIKKPIKIINKTCKIFSFDLMNNFLRKIIKKFIEKITKLNNISNQQIKDLSIKKKIIVILYRIVKLPFLLIQDFIKIFVN